MLIGEYEHTFDTKNRVSLPSKFRKQFGKKLIITRGLDKCLFIYSKSEWDTFVGRLSELSVGQSDSRSFNRFILSGATEVEVDSAGRVLIAGFLREFAGIKQKVVINGVGNRAEIWGEKEWGKYKLSLEKNADEFAENLGRVGMI